MISMFEGCSALESLDLSHFNTFAVRFMGRMFYGCSSLESVDLSSFKTLLATDMESMFSGCSSLESVDLSTFNTSSVENTNAMFEGCASVEKVKLGLNVTKLTSFPTGSTGNWTSANDGSVLSVDDILTKRLGIADTYTEVPAANSLANAVVTVSPTTMTYTGQELKPSVTVRLADKTLTEGTDYTLTYRDNIEIGTATVVARGKGDYVGKKEATFSIVSESSGGQGGSETPDNPDDPNSGSGAGGDGGGNGGGSADNPSSGSGGSGSGSDSGSDSKPDTPDSPNSGSNGSAGNGGGSNGSSNQDSNSGGSSASDNGKKSDSAAKFDPLAHVGAAKKAGFTDLDSSAWYMKVPDGAFKGTNALFIDYVVGSGLMSGYSGTTLFGPDDTVSRAMVATVIYRMATGVTADTADNNVATRFPDVSSGKWYSAAIAWCDEKGVITGYTDTGLFDPEKSVSREELALMVARYCINVGGMQSAGTDVSAFPDGNLVSDWALKGVAFCSAHGIVTGYSDSGRFDPAGSATRCQMAKIIALASQLRG